MGSLGSGRRMKLSLLLLLVLVCLALLAFDEGDAFRSKHKLSRHRTSRRKKSSRRVHTRRKFPKRRRRSSRKSSKTSKRDSSSLSRLHSKLDKFDKKLDRLKLNCDCYKGAQGKNHGLEHMCADGTVPMYEDSSRFACCRPEEELINGACVTTSCGIKTVYQGVADPPGDGRIIRMEDFTLDGSGFSGTFMIGEDDEMVSSGQEVTETFADGVLFSCTRQGCCELTGEARDFSGFITYY